LSANRLEEISGGVDKSTTPAVEEVRDAVLRLKGMVGEASTLAAQLASARRRRLLCVDSRRQRQLPQLPTADRSLAADLRRFPTRSLQLSDTKGEMRSDFACSTSTETSGFESNPALGEDACRNSSTSTTADLASVRGRRNAVDFLHIEDTQPAQRLVQVPVPETDTDLGTRNTEQNQVDGRQRLLIETSKTVVVEEDQSDGPASNCDQTAEATINDNLAPCHSLTAAISGLLRIVRGKASFRRFADLVLCVQNSAMIACGLNCSEKRSAIPTVRRTPLHVVTVILLAAVVVYLVFFSYDDDVCEFSCQQANGRTRRSWVAALWSKSGLQFRHIAPPPV